MPPTTETPSGADSPTPRLAGYAIGVAVMLGAAATVVLPLILSPIAVEGLLPGASWRFPFQWWFVPTGAVLFFVLSLASTVPEAFFYVLFPRPEQKRMRDALEAVLGVAVVAACYAVVLTPWPACLIAAAAGHAVMTALETAFPLGPERTTAAP